MSMARTAWLRAFLPGGMVGVLLIFLGGAVWGQDGGDGGPPDGIPPVGAPPDGGGPPDGVPPVSRGSADLAPTTEECADADASGRAHLVSNSGHDFIHVVLHNLEAGAVFEVRICLGDMQETLGSVTIRPKVEGDDEMMDDGGAGVDMDGEEGSAGVLRVDTIRGDSLPLGADDVSDLSGALIKVVDAAGCVVLSGEIVPRPTGEGGEDEGDDGADDGEGGDAAGGFALSVPHDASFLRGDTSMDDELNLSDPIQTLNLLFLGGVAPYCLDAADSNDDGSLNISDPVTTLGALFLGSGPLPPPSEARGFDPTPDTLFCQ